MLLLARDFLMFLQTLYSTNPSIKYTESKQGFLVPNNSFLFVGFFQ